MDDDGGRMSLDERKRVIEGTIALTRNAAIVCAATTLRSMPETLRGNPDIWGAVMWAVAMAVTSMDEYLAPARLFAVDPKVIAARAAADLESLRGVIERIEAEATRH